MTSDKVLSGRLPDDVLEAAQAVLADILIAPDDVADGTSGSGSRLTVDLLERGKRRLNSLVSRLMS